MNNPEKLAAKGTQDDEKHKILCVGHYYAPASTNNVTYKTTQKKNTISNTDPAKKSDGEPRFSRRVSSSCFL